MRDWAELAGLDDLRGFLEMLPRALLRPDLYDAVGASIGLQRGHRPIDRVGERLLDVDVLAGRDRIDDDLAVPMVGRGDVHGIDVLAIENAAVVLARLDRHAILFVLERRDPTIEPGLEHIRSGDVLRVGMFQEEVRDLGAPAAAPDQAEAHTIVGALHTRPRACRHRRHNRAAGRGPEKLATRDG